MSENYSLRHFCTSYFIVGLLVIIASACSDSVSPEDDFEEEEQEISADLTTEEAEEIIMAFLEDIGIFSAEYFDRSKTSAIPLPTDYVTIGETDGGNIRIDLWVDSEGVIIPDAKWRNENENYCSSRNRYMRAPQYLLAIEIHPDTQTVFVRLIEVETSQIKMQQEGHSDSEFWVLDAITEAWNKLEDVGHFQAGDPCGDEAGMILEFNSKIETRTMYEGEMVKFVSRVIARVPIEMNDDQRVFRGTEALVHIEEDYYHPISEIIAQCEYNFSDGQLDAKITFSEDGFSDAPGITALVGADLLDHKPMAFYTCTSSEGDITTGEDMQWWLSYSLANQERVIPEGWYYPGDGYRYGSWSGSDDPNIIAQSSINRTAEYTGEGVTHDIDEHTTLRILHAD